MLRGLTILITCSNGCTVLWADQHIFKANSMQYNNYVYKQSLIRMKTYTASLVDAHCKEYIVHLLYCKFI